MKVVFSDDFFFLMYQLHFLLMQPVILFLPAASKFDHNAMH